MSLPNKVPLPGGVISSMKSEKHATLRSHHRLVGVLSGAADEAIDELRPLYVLDLAKCEESLLLEHRREASRARARLAGGTVEDHVHVRGDLVRRHAVIHCSLDSASDLVDGRQDFVVVHDFEPKLGAGGGAARVRECGGGLRGRCSGRTSKNERGKGEKVLRDYAEGAYGEQAAGEQAAEREQASSRRQGWRWTSFSSSFRAGSIWRPTRARLSKIANGFVQSTERGLRNTSFQTSNYSRWSHLATAKAGGQNKIQDPESRVETEQLVKTTVVPLQFSYFVVILLFCSFEPRRCCGAVPGVPR